jgi:hypothetical protein
LEWCTQRVAASEPIPGLGRAQRNHMACCHPWHCAMAVPLSPAHGERQLVCALHPRNTRGGGGSYRSASSKIAHLGFALPVWTRWLDCAVRALNKPCRPCGWPSHARCVSRDKAPRAHVEHVGVLMGCAGSCHSVRKKSVVRREKGSRAQPGALTHQHDYGGASGAGGGR